MRRLFFCIAALAFLVPTLGHAQMSYPKIFIAPQNGYESYLAGAFTKKNVPAQIVQTGEASDYILKPAPVEQKPESTGGKNARWLFASSPGIGGSPPPGVAPGSTNAKTIDSADHVQKGPARTSTTRRCTS